MEKIWFQVVGQTNMSNHLNIMQQVTTPVPLTPLENLVNNQLQAPLMHGPVQYATPQCYSGEDTKYPVQDFVISLVYHFNSN